MNNVTVCFFHDQNALLIETYADYIFRRVEYKWDIQLTTVIDTIQNTIRVEVDTEEYGYIADEETLRDISQFIAGIHTCLKTIEQEGSIPTNP